MNSYLCSCLGHRHHGVDVIAVATVLALLLSRSPSSSRSLLPSRRRYPLPLSSCRYRRSRRSLRVAVVVVASSSAIVSAYSTTSNITGTASAPTAARRAGAVCGEHNVMHRHKGEHVEDRTPGGWAWPHGEDVYRGRRGALRRDVEQGQYAEVIACCS